MLCFCAFCVILFTQLFGCSPDTPVEPSIYNLIRGRYIHDVYTDKARYAPRERAVISAIVYNPGEETLNGVVVYSITHLGEQIDTASRNISLDIAESFESRLAWNTIDTDYTGYAIEIELYGENGMLLDYAMTALDVSSDWNLFPRYGYLTKFGRRSHQETKQVLFELNKYHINGLFYFDHIDRHDTPLAGTRMAPEDTWKNLAMSTIEAQTIFDLINIGHSMNMLSFSYNLLFGAYPDYENVGAKSEWGIFTDPEQKIFDYHPLPSTWKAGSILLMDPQNPGWQDFFIKNYIEFMGVFPFDGIQMDSLGGRPYPIYDYNGDLLNLGERYSGLLDRMQTELETRLIFNAVSKYGQKDVVENVTLDIMFAEVWPWCHPSYYSLKETLDESFSVTDNGMVIPAYMNYNVSKQLEYFNTPGVLYTNAVLFAAGGAHLELGDHGMLSSEYYPARTPAMSKELERKLRNYYSFMTAYQNVLRGGGLDEITCRAAIEGQLASVLGAAGNIWAFAKRKDGGVMDILHLINFTGLTSTEWVDNYGTQPAPNILKEKSLQFHTDLAPVSVWMASPDYLQGYITEIPYTTGIDDNGAFIRLTLPYLEYWSMLVIKYA